MMKGYKVTDKSRRKLVGVACDSLTQLLAKGREKLGLDGALVAALDDGTIVDDEDYFQAIPPQTIIVLYRKGEDIITGVDVILNALRRVNSSYLETGSKAHEFIISKTNELADLLKEREREEEGRALKNTPQEDPDWFEGLDTNARTKEEFMFRKSQDRIRGYFYKFREDIRKSEAFARDPEFRKIGQQCLEYLKGRLKEDEYFGCYFDRRCASQREIDGPPVKRPKCRGSRKARQSYDKLSYCDISGKFVCQGKWKLESCEFVGEHHINPYLSKEARILFSTWNLDHRIERSRSVLPSLAGAIRGCGKSRSVNFLYFYQLLFTKLNLKLVHVVCHDKTVHEVSCDPRFLYT